MTTRVKQRTQLLVLTCAVTPKNAPRLVRSDTHLRRADYQQSCREWARILAGSNVDVLLVENTGTNVDFLVEEFTEKNVTCSVISYDESQAIQSLGKGNAEAAMFDRVATWLQDVQTDYSFVYKCTGRLTVSNFFNTVYSDMHAYADIAARVRFDRTQVDTRYFAVKPHVWIAGLTGLSALVKEEQEVYLEHVVALQLAKRIFLGDVWRPFKRFPVVNGFSASTGMAYGGRRERLAGEASTIFGRRLFKHYL